MTTALTIITEVPSAADVLASLAALAACTPEELFGCYSDLHKNDHGVRPYRTDAFSMALWIASRPRRACGYQDPAEYAADLEWLAECEAEYAREQAEWAAKLDADMMDDAGRAAPANASPANDWLDFDLDARGRVRLYA